VIAVIWNAFVLKITLPAMSVPSRVYELAAGICDDQHIRPAAGLRSKLIVRPRTSMVCGVRRVGHIQTAARHVHHADPARRTVAENQVRVTTPSTLHTN